MPAVREADHVEGGPVRAAEAVRRGLAGKVALPDVHGVAGEMPAEGREEAAGEGREAGEAVLRIWKGKRKGGTETARQDGDGGE